MRILAFALLLIPIALPAGAQRTSAHDGVYEGSRVQECRRTGQAGRTRVVGQLRGASFSIDSLPGDPPLEAIVNATGGVTLPSFGMFGGGTGQIFEGPNNARRFAGSHPGRGECQMVYEMRRSSARLRN